MTSAEILSLMGSVHCLLRDQHIVYTSGRHGSSYVNKDALYPHTKLTSQLCREMARCFADANVDVVLAPAIGGVILSQWVAFHLTELTKRNVLAVYAEKAADGEGFVIKRGYDKLIEGKRVLVLEDVLTTGISVRRVVETARGKGATIIGVAALCNRGGLTAETLGRVPKFEALVTLSLDSWDASECPLCASHVAINEDVGKGREYLQKQRQRG